MLAEFRVRNFRNFRDELVFSLESSKNYEFNSSAVSNGIIKDSVIVGHNATGKTNLGYAILDIVNHLTDKKKKIFSAALYTNLCTEEPVAHFFYKFRFGSDVLEYTYEKKNSEQVIREILYINKKLILSNDMDTCTLDLKGTETLNTENWKGSMSLVKYVFANAILDDGDPYCKVFMDFMQYVNRMLCFSSTEGLRYIGYTTGSGNVLETISTMENGVLGLQDFLQELGLDFKLEAKDKGEGMVIYAIMGEKEIPFHFLWSSGTRALVFLFLWYYQRKEISFIYIDEFDAFYHTDLSVAVIRKLMESDNIQVIFTSHNTDILSNELLRPDCYFQLENNKITPFSESTDKALREAHNIQKMYKAGAFS